MGTAAGKGGAAPKLGHAQRPPDFPEVEGPLPVARVLGPVRLVGRHPVQEARDTRRLQRKRRLQCQPLRQLLCISLKVVQPLTQFLAGGQTNSRPMASGRPRKIVALPCSPCVSGMQQPAAAASDHLTAAPWPQE